MFADSMNLDSVQSIPSPHDFLGCNLHPVTTGQFIEVVTDAAQNAAQNNEKLTVTYINAHCSNLAAKDVRYREVLNRCGIVYADGKGVVWAARFLGRPVPERVNAGDFIIEFCRVCAEKKLRVFLLGCAEGLAEGAARYWQWRVPGLQVAGTHHGFFKADEEEGVVARINEAKPDVLIVGMSAPVQELWMDRWAGRLDAPVVWCVGALFEYYSGVRARAPEWVRRIGMEWLFRLMLEPRRLWKRYVVGNGVFVGRVLRTRFRKR